MISTPAPHTSPIHHLLAGPPAAAAATKGVGAGPPAWYADPEVALALGSCTQMAMLSWYVNSMVPTAESHLWLSFNSWLLVAFYSRVKCLRHRNAAGLPHPSQGSLLCHESAMQGKDLPIFPVVIFCIWSMTVWGPSSDSVTAFASLAPALMNALMPDLAVF
jgi:hypothetical protein